ncbi:SDR family NAD(P)-dependent oxidoreductase [Pendulispora rubella]|uniref:SDR family NAD(P)-dependent oxidoreductase n=1 Tax=Pendulispora rubella TaxID=2741070 RepID=A0ABZ2L2S6_9BACT
MSDSSADLAVQKRTLLALKKLQAKVDALEHARNEPIAIIGAGCRFPGGVTDLASYRQLLREGGDAIVEVPKDRWDIDRWYDPDPDANGKMYTRAGGFLQGSSVADFDARFFGITRREANAMDPQQRMLLEVGWEALEHAGLPPTRLAGSRTGVFVGISVSDYSFLSGTVPSAIDPYTATGWGFAFSAGRISYVLGLQGPSMAVDTACSSSLVSVHLACQSLRAGECTTALAGGVMLLLSPLSFVMLSRLRALSPDGRCKTFDAAANGIARGEGCGMVVLKRLSDARRDGDRVLATLLGGGVQHDGASSSFTVPNGRAQQAVMREALTAARLAPADVGYVEAHGTGTILGDPIEVDALAAVYGEGRDAATPLAVGSVKTNLGHLESAAGIAGLLKAVLAVQGGELFPHLHVREPNPHIAWERLPVRVADASTPWPADRRRVAGVSAFGMSGTNAHMLVGAVEEAPSAARSPSHAVHLLPLSAKSPEALRMVAQRYAGALEDASLEDICFTASTGRVHFEHRAAVLGTSAGELREKLVALAEGTAPEAPHTAQDPALADLAALYIKGDRIDWADVHRGGGHRLCTLPAYPFQRQRYWITTEAASEAPLPQASSARGELARTLQEAPARRRRDLLTAHVAAAVRTVLALGPDEPLDLEAGFFNLGVDSLMSAELRKRLEVGLDHALSATVTFDHPSVRSMVDHLLRALPYLEGAAIAPVVTATRAAHEPIAIIGMACRFPGGANDVEAYWTLLRDGVDGTSDMPPERWDVDAFYSPEKGAPGKMSTRRGGFLRGVPFDGFDAEFFGMAPREASAMDPQQRLLLEVGWEALEDAGCVPEHLAASRTAVMVGIASSDYLALQNAGPASRLEPYMVTGTAHSCAAGRLSFTLGLQGPCLSIDTACSSSLVAAHLACQSLVSGEADLALVAGVNMMLAPEPFVFFSQAGALAADGRCKTFDASGDGYARGEGCGAVVLKRLSDAQRHGDRLRAVVRGSAVNHDGRTSALSVPNGPAQEAVIRQAFANAGMEPARVGYVEAHAAGTPLGDPIEMQALAAALGEGRGAENPLLVGSAKTNIGHLEASAGIAGLIKGVLILEHGEVPPHLHLREPTPLIPWERLGVNVPVERTPFRHEVVGVSSFGMSGTNAHLVLEQAPRPAEGPAASPRAHCLPLSARSPEALRAIVQRYVAELNEGSLADAHCEDVSFTAGARRGHHAHRVAVVGRTREEWIAALKGVFEPAVVPLGRRKWVFVFSGLTTPWPGMAAGLLRDEPIFRDALTACSEAIAKHAPFSVRDLIAEGQVRADSFDLVQPALFAVQVSLAALWRAWGIEPEAVVGHSMGEVAAAHVAGALSLDDAAHAITVRSQLIRRVQASGARGGAMVIEVPYQEAPALLEELGVSGSVFIAGANAPRITVLSGEPRALEGVLSALKARNVFCQRLATNVAGHSPALQALEGDLLRELASLRPRRPEIPFFSSVPGQGPEPAFDAAYWAANLIRPVHLWPAVERLLNEGYDGFLELGVHPSLINPIEQGLHQVGAKGVVLSSLRRPEDDRTVMLQTAASLFAAGAPVDFRRIGSAHARVVDLPKYPWQRKRHWTAPSAASPEAKQTAPSRVHPLLGVHLVSARASKEHFFDIASDAALWRDHRAHGVSMLPSTLLLEAVLAAAVEASKRGSSVLESWTVHEPALLGDDGSVSGQLVLVPGDGARMRFELYDASQSLHASGELRTAAEDGAPVAIALSEVRARCTRELTGAQHLERLEECGLAYGESFAGLERIWRGDGEALGLFRLPEGTDANAFRVHPPAIEMALRLTAGVLSGEDPRMPVRFEGVRFHRRITGRHCWLHTRHLASGALRVSLLDDAGRVAMEASSVHLAPGPRALVEAAADRASGEWLYDVAWQPAPPLAPAPGSPSRGTYLVLTDAAGVGEPLVRALAARGHEVITAVPGARAELGPHAVAVDPQSHEDWHWLLQRAGSALRGVVHLWGLDAPAMEGLALEELAAAQRVGCSVIPPLVRALSTHDTGAKIWFVTRGTQPASPSASLNVVQAPLWGMARVVALEHPEWWGGLVDLDPRPSPHEADVLLAEILHSDGEDQVAYRDGTRRVARLVRTSGEELPAAVTFRDDATYLVVGGVRGLGLDLAGWMVERGARHLVLTGRSPGDSEPAVSALERAGASVRVRAVDVGDAAQMQALFAEVASSGPALKGVIHAAGINRAAPLAEVDAPLLESVLAAKVRGGWLLEQLTAALPLDFMALLSSVAGTWGAASLGPYSAANHFLDALAHHRRAQGRAATSIGLGTWAGGGMGVALAENPKLKKLFSQMGYSVMSPAPTLEILGRFTGTSATQRVLTNLDWSRFKPIFETKRRRPLLDEIAIEGAEWSGPAAGELRTKLAAVSDADERFALLRGHVRARVAEAMGYEDATTLQSEQGFFQLGMDSIMSVQLRMRLQTDLMQPLPPTMVFEHPTVKALAGFLLGTLGTMPSTTPTAPPPADPAPADGQLSEDELVLQLANELAELGVNLDESQA